METQTPESMTPHEEFEFLCASHLCGELTAEDESRLEQLLARNPEWRGQMDRYKAMQRILDEVPRKELKHAFRRGPWNVRNVAFGRKRIVLSSAAALLLAAGAVILLGFPTKTRTLAFPHGRCASGGQPVAQGAKIGGSLESGADSFCDVQIEDGGRVALRVFPNARVRFHSGRRDLHISVDRGKVLVDAASRSGRGLLVHAPGHRVRIVGTRILVAHDSPGTVDVELLDGRAVVRSALFLELPRLQRNFAEPLRAAAAVEEPNLFRMTVTRLAPGERVRLVRQGLDQTQALRVGAALEQALTDLSLRGRPSKALGAVVASRIRQAVQKSPELREMLAGARIDAQVNKLPSSRRWQLERSFQGLSGGGHGRGPGLPDRLVESNSGDSTVKQAPASILKALKEERPGKLLYRIHLKDGRVLTGIVEQEGSRYRLLTEHGDVLIERSGVKRLELYLE